MLPSTSLALACLSGRRLYTFAAPTSDSPAAYSSEGAPSSQWPVDYSTSLTHWDTKIANQTSNVQKIYPGYGLDAPRVAPINGTVSDWWYFHAFSLNGDGDVSSVNFNFYTTSPGGYPLLQNKSTILDLEIFGSFPNGTNYWANEYPQTASVMTAGSSSNGKWGPYGSWESSPDGKYWQLDFDMPTSELVGTVKIHSVCARITVPWTARILTLTEWCTTSHCLWPGGRRRRARVPPSPVVVKRPRRR